MRHLTRAERLGLRIVCSAAPDSEMLSAALAVRVGARSETPAWSGLAHLAEHVACGLWTPDAERLGAVGGTCNAVTQPDFTLYHGSVVAEHGERLLNRLLEILDSSAADDARIKAEVGTVEDEISAAIDGAVMGGFPWLWLPAALYDDPELAHNGYGDLVSLTRVDSGALTAFFKRYYHAGNAVLAITAPDLEPVLAHLGVAGSLSTVAPVAPALHEPPRVTFVPLIRLHAPNQPHQATAIAWSLEHQPLTAGHYAAAVLADVLVGQYGGLLDGATDTLEVAAYVGPFADPWGVAAPLPFVVELHHETDTDPLASTAVVLDQLRRVAAGVDPALVSAAVGTLSTQFRVRWDDPIERPKVAAAAEVVYGRAERTLEIPQQLARVEAVAVSTAADDLAGDPYRVLTRGPHS